MPRCWLASLPKGTAQGHAHTCSYTLSHSQHTHAHTPMLLRAVVCFDWRIGRAVLTPLWHSIPFRWTSLFTNYSEQNATCVIVYVSLCMCVCPRCLWSIINTHFPRFTFTSLFTHLIKVKLCVFPRPCAFMHVRANSVYAVSLLCFFCFLGMVVCRCVQTRSGEQWCCCNPVNRHSV